MFNTCLSTNILIKNLGGNLSKIKIQQVEKKKTEEKGENKYKTEVLRNTWSDNIEREI